MRTLFLIATIWLWLLAGLGSAQDYPWCSTMDDVFAEIVGEHLVLSHENATYNCCPDSFTFTVTTSNDSLYVIEREVLTTPCDCMCCFNLSALVEGLSPGDWQVVYRWLDDEPWGWRDWHMEVTISDLGPTGPIQIASSEAVGCLDPSGTPEDLNIPVSSPGLLQNSPNPFNPRTTIAFDLPGPQSVSLRVFDMAGRLVKELITAEEHTSGRHEVVWNGTDDAGRQVTSGTYFYRLETGAFSETRRMTLVK